MYLHGGVLESSGAISQVHILGALHITLLGRCRWSVLLALFLEMPMEVAIVGQAQNVTDAILYTVCVVLTSICQLLCRQEHTCG